jgi:hypothetical protein
VCVFFLSNKNLQFYLIDFYPTSSAIIIIADPLQLLLLLRRRVPRLSLHPAPLCGNVTRIAKAKSSVSSAKQSVSKWVINRKESRIKLKLELVAWHGTMTATAATSDERFQDHHRLEIIFPANSLNHTI